MSTESQLHILLSADTWHEASQLLTLLCSVVTCTIHSDHAPKYSAPAGFSHGDVSSFTIDSNLTSSYPNYHLQLPSIELKVELYISNRTLQSTFRS